MNTTISPRLNAELLEENYAQWKEDPNSVDPIWAAFFEGFDLGMTQPVKLGDSASVTQVGTSAVSDQGRRARVFGLIYTYRTLGHTAAWTDPLMDSGPEQQLLDRSEFGFSDADDNLEVSSKFYRKDKVMKLKDLIAELKSIYCDHIGFEFMHIHNTEVRHWLRDRIEERNKKRPSGDVQKRALKTLLETQLFENFLQKRYSGEKRFSIEGGESLLVSLDTISETGPEQGVQEIVMGMAHRGRLNVLANFLEKSPSVLFYEFSANYVPNTPDGDGDVKYHLGYESIRRTSSGDDVSVYLAANPSHLEAVNSVVEGKARARQRIIGDADERTKVVPVLVHGDAAFAGQGAVAEVLNLSQLPGYRTGGTIHIIVNNQIGFTTMPEDARSSDYCTDVAKMIEAPVFHVNGDYPLEVRWVTKLALEFRQKFGRDVIIDIVGYRRHGHNEGDAPEFTQPQTYRKLKTKETAAQGYRQRLIERGVLDEKEADAMETAIFSKLEEANIEAKKLGKDGGRSLYDESSGAPQPPYTHEPVMTSITKKLLKEIGLRLAYVPDDFKVNDKIKRRFLDKRAEATNKGGPFNWSMAEALAFGSLLVEKSGVRLSGQDCRRGTFSQRHAVLYDSETRDRWIPLKHIREGDQGQFCVYNSLLSEAAVLGFDYGYTLMCPTMLIMWEAQFGDFSNGAQVIIDQFIASAESKWQQPSNIVMLLPHGYEGMGPEHSSARLERFLQLCAESNMQVCNLTTPAQYFHALRRQVHRQEIRKPLILMTPKSLLGKPECVSMEDEFTGQTHFLEVIDDKVRPEGDEDKVTRMIFCSGKVYYDLLKERESRGARTIRSTVIVRIEQLYPLNAHLLKIITDRYPNASKWVWCQEEPLNMGAWTFVGPRLQKLTKLRVRYAGRVAAASTAAGSKIIHKNEQKMLVEQAFSV